MFLLELDHFRARPDHVRQLAARRTALMRALRTRYSGFRSTHIARVCDDQWVHVSFWNTREDAEHAALEIFALPEMEDWRAHIGEWSAGPVAAPV